MNDPHPLFDKAVELVNQTVKTYSWGSRVTGITWDEDETRTRYTIKGVINHMDIYACDTPDAPVNEVVETE